MTDADTARKAVPNRSDAWLPESPVAEPAAVYQARIEFVDYATQSAEPVHQG